MALGGFLAIADRRYRIAGPRRARRRRSPARAHERERWPRIKRMRYGRCRSAIFAVLVAFLFVGLFRDPREVPSPLIGKPAPAFALAQLHAPAQDARHRRHARPGVAAQRLGVVVRVLPRRASAAGRARARRTSCRSSGLDYKDKDDRRQGVARASTAIRTRLSVVDADGRVGIDWGVYGVPETFVVDKAGVIRYKHIGPVTRRGAAADDPAAGARAAEAIVTRGRSRVARRVVAACSPRREPRARSVAAPDRRARRSA